MSFVRNFNCVFALGDQIGSRGLEFEPNYVYMHNVESLRKHLMQPSGLLRDIVKFVPVDMWNSTTKFNRFHNIVSTQRLKLCREINSTHCRYSEVKNHDNGSRVESVGLDSAVCKSCPNCFCLHGRHVVEGDTLAFEALQILFYMGCESAYMVGVDHIFANTTAEKIATLTKRGPIGSDFTGNIWNLTSLMAPESSYVLAKDIWFMRHRLVVDATTDSELTLLPKVSETFLQGMRSQDFLFSNIPNVVCQPLNFSEDPWLTRTSENLPRLSNFASHMSVVLQRIRKLSATICMQESGHDIVPILSIMSILPPLMMDDRNRNTASECTLGMLENVVEVAGFYHSEVIFVLFSNSTGTTEIEEHIFDYMRGNENIVMVKLHGDTDVNMADALNFITRYVSRGNFLTTWSIYDRKPNLSLLHLIEALESQPNIDIVSSFFHTSDKVNQRWIDSVPEVVSHVFDAPQYILRSPSDFFEVSMLHSSFFHARNPLRYGAMWRSSLHDIYGWFDYSANTLVSWELGLRAVVLGARYLLLNMDLNMHYNLPPDGPDLNISDPTFFEIVNRYASELSPAIVANVHSRRT